MRLHLLIVATIVSTNTKHAAAMSSSWPQIRSPSSTAQGNVERDPTENDLLSVPGIMNYCSSKVTAVTSRRDLGGTDGALEGAEWVHETVRVRNARKEGDSVTLDQHGFQLLKSPVTISSSASDSAAMELFLDSDQCVKEYYPQCEALVKRLTGASTVCAFDHNVRSSGRAGSKLEAEGSTQAVIQEPAGMVHNDYTKVSAPRRLQQLAQVPKSDNDVLKSRLQNEQSVVHPTIVQQALNGEQRYAFINVWRNIRAEPVASIPLACVNAQTQSMDELLTFQIIYADRIGENYFTRYSPRHEWNYFPGMTRDEALVIKQWDSEGDIAKGKDDNGRQLSTFSLHSAFMDPTSALDAPARESIEVRCIVIWDKE